MTAAGWLVFLAAAAARGAAADSQSSQLPSAAKRPVTFDGDIRPLLETSCLRCHGPQNPKSHFSLVSRASALMGGDENTNDIVPGNSAHSLLIHYVARQVPDMEMPPDGRGKPLTPQQIGLLRAWIDQGARWGATNSGPVMNLTVAPTLRWIKVQGNAGKFRELEGAPAGLSGGLEQFSLREQVRPDETISVDGHAIMPEQDIDIRLAWNKTGRGFVHAGFEQWRKYYNDAGGYDPAVTPPGFFFDRDLHVDHGRAWVDLGLDLPRWPLIVLGYEYQYQQGDESTLAWGYANGKNIYPATESLDEHTHIIKLDVIKNSDDWRMEDQARVEFFSADNTGHEAWIQSGGTVPDQLFTTRDNYSHVQGMNTFTVEKQIRDWWMVSAGLYYSHLSGNDYFNQTAGPAFGYTLNSQRITLNRESEIFSAASLFTPLECLPLSLGTQNAWTQESGSGAGIPVLNSFGTVNLPADSKMNEFQASQSATAQFTKIPATVVFGDLRFNEDNYGIDQAENPNEFQYDTVANNFRYVLTPGVTVSPRPWCEATAQYTWRSSRTDYDPSRDVWLGVPGGTNGYPGFILNRTIRSEQLEAKLVLQPVNWLKTTLSYQLGATHYSATTDPAYDFLGEPVSPGGSIADGNYHLQTFGIGATLTPVRRWYFSGAFTYSQSRAVTADHGSPSVAPYEGNIFTLTTIASYAINLKTGLQIAYNFSHAGYGQNNAAAGIPTGLDYTRHQVIAGLTRKLTERLSAALHYEFALYSEPSSGTANNFTANGVFVTLVYRWP